MNLCHLLGKARKKELDQFASKYILAVAARVKKIVLHMSIWSGRHDIIACVTYIKA